MEQQQDVQNKSHNDQGDKQCRISPAVTEIAIAVWIFLGLCALLWLVIGNNIADEAKRFEVGIMAMLNIAIVIIVVVHAIIYHRQTGAMNAQLAATQETAARERAQVDPRLRVSKIRMENFQVGLSPIFITTVANDGFIDATGVELHIGIKFGHDRKFNWAAPQIVTIPARGQESYPIFAGAFFSEEDFEGFNTNRLPIEVSVGVKYWPGSPTELRQFCYRYLPWYGGQRPDDIPQFVPCDFDPRLNITLKMPTAVLKHTAGINVIRAQIKKAETRGDSEGEGENPN